MRAAPGFHAAPRRGPITSPAAAANPAGGYNVLVQSHAPNHPPDHPFVVSYLALRRAIGGIGLAFPVVLWVGGWAIAGVPMQANLSAYYHTPLRDVFVGLLVTQAALFFCYRGHDRAEDWTANLAGVFALGLAFFPIDVMGEGSSPMVPRSIVGLVHTISGGGFFLTLAIYSLLHFPRTASGPEHEPHPVQRQWLYRLGGGSILLSMVAMGVYLMILPPTWRAVADAMHALFWLEWVAIWSFAAAWLLKGRVIVLDLAVNLGVAAGSRLLARATDRGS